MSRYILEDVLQCHVGTRFLLLVAKSEDVRYNRVPSKAANTQRQNGMGGTVCVGYLALITTV